MTIQNILFVENFLNCSKGKRKPCTYFSYTDVWVILYEPGHRNRNASFKVLFGRPAGLSVLFPLFLT